MLEIYDLEVFPNFHSISYLDKYKDELNFICIHPLRDEREEYKTHLSKLIQNKGWQVGFNNIDYDYPLEHFIIGLSNSKEWDKLSTTDLLYKIYEKSQELIPSDDKLQEEGYVVSKWQKKKYNSIRWDWQKIPQIDVRRINHWDNPGRMASLKKLQFNMRWNNVQSLIYPYDSFITLDQIDEIQKYNENDVLSTNQLYEITRGDKDKITVSFAGLSNYIGKDRITFRKEYAKEYKIPTEQCINWSDVKLGEMSNKYGYLKATGIKESHLKNLSTIRDSIRISDLISPLVAFESPKLIELLNKLNDTLIYIDGKRIFNHKLIFAGNVIKVALGGLHSKDKSRIIKKKPNKVLRDIDVGSLYPTMLINLKLFPEHLGIEWLINYTKDRDKRLQLKPFSKKDKSIEMLVEIIKLKINGGGFGKTGEQYNWQRDEKVMYGVTINGQLYILMLIEALSKYCTIYSCNTDGVIIEYDEKDTELINKICKDWEIKTNCQLEDTFYEKIIQRNISSYIAVKTDGKIKLKGDFEIECELHKDTSQSIVTKALVDYFVKGIKITDTIHNCKNILDFCIYHKFGKTQKGEYEGIYYTLQEGNRIKQNMQKDVRFYVDDTGHSKLVGKCIKGKDIGKEIEVVAGFSTTIFNQYIDKPFDEYRVNYTYYIKETRKIINEIESNQLTLF